MKLFGILMLISAKNWLTSSGDIQDFTSFRELGKGVLNGVFQTFDALAEFLMDFDPPKITHDEAIQLYCANPTNKSFDRVFYKDPELRSKIDVSKSIGFLVHGWTSSADTSWMIAVSNDWVRLRDMNVCRVNWKQLADAGYILASVRNARIAANHLSHFIKMLKPHGIRPENLTIVGHSLGAHVSGFVGAKFDGRVRQIIGLDAAGPLFTIPFPLPAEFRLDQSDAKQVTMIHSSSGFLGVSIPSGHQDFYGNRGIAPQEGCLGGPNYYPTYAYDAISCSHNRAIDFFQSSLNPDNQCVAIQCENLFRYGLKQCGSVVTRLGLDAALNINGQFYFSTGGKPFCSGNFW